MTSEYPTFESLVHPELPQFESYLDSQQVMELRTILARVTNHRVAETERSNYDARGSTGFSDYVDNKRAALQGGYLDQAGETAWRERLGTREEDLHALIAIGAAFTERYNTKNLTELSTKDGRALMLKMALAHQLENRTEEEGR